MHDAALRFIAQEAARLPGEVRVYEIGSRNINGSARRCFPRARAYHGIDLRPGPDVDAVANGSEYAPPFIPDVVLCCEVFEHTAHAKQLCARAHALLTEGGTFLATMAGPKRAPHSGIDGGLLHPGEFYQNLDPEQLARWCTAFVDVRIEVSAGLEDLYLVCHRLRVM